MLRPDKKNFLLSCEVDQKISDIKSELQKHDLAFGYHPLASGDFSLKDLIHNQPLNLYYFKHASLLDNIAAIHAELDNGDTVQTSLLSAHQACPDFCRLILGLPSRIARITQVTLKIILKPEKIQIIMLLLPQSQNPQKLLSQLIARRLEPLFFRLFEKSEIKKISPSPKRNRQAHTAILSGFSGLTEIVEAKLKFLHHLAQTQNLELVHPDKNSGTEWLDQHIFAAENQNILIEQYQKMIWPVEKNRNTQKHLEQAFFKTFDPLEVNHV